MPWLRFLEVLDDLCAHPALVSDRGVERVEQQHGQRVARLDLGNVGEDVRRQIGQFHRLRLRPGVLFAVSDGLRLAVFRKQKVLFAQTADRAVVFRGDHDVEYDDARVGLENLCGAVSGGCGLAGRGKDRGEDGQKNNQPRGAGAQTH